jgi:hypothetical protein
MQNNNNTHTHTHMCTYVYSYTLWPETALLWPGPPLLRFLRVHNTHTHIRGTVPLYKRLARHGRRFLLNTQQKQETNSHAYYSGIRTRDFSNRAAVGVRVRPHCDRTWHTNIYIYN